MQSSLRTLRQWLWLSLLLCAPLLSLAEDAPGRWPVEKANAWLTQHGWMAGCNFIPSTAINQLEMWQAETFDEATIDRELGLAESLGFKTVRVFLHDLAWRQDPAGFLERMDRFLTLTSRHKIGVLFAIFDSCWHPLPKVGPQPAPIPHTHNSGWVQSPGIEVLQHPEQQGYLHDYVVAVVKRFANDARIDGWDVWNEPDNFDGGSAGRPGLEPQNKPALMLALLPQVFAWAREANPTQPLTSGVWRGDWSEAKLSPTHRVQLANSDIISFHNYGKLEDLRRCVETLQRFGRPIMCTEFMARPNGSTFDPHLAYLREQKVASYCWGFVSGKTQTIYPWDSWRTSYHAEPPVWFHDIFRTDGTPYRPEEVAYIRKVTGHVEAALPAAAYQNPVMHGDYPDPSIIRSGEDYYVSATSSEWAPHFPILHSKDLVNWEPLGAIFETSPPWAEKNFWAPELSQWHGRFYAYYVARERGGPLAVAVATADRPEGPWTDHGPLIAQPAGSIDPMAVDDEHGERWLVWKEDGNSRKQPTPIWAQRLNEDGTKLVGEMHELLRNDAPWEGPLIEGPFVLRRGEWFYLFFAGNACCGRGCSYGVGVARAKALLGPWEKCAANPIVATNEHFRGPGHGSIVETPEGRLYFAYHSYRLPSFIYTGREMMLDEVTFGADGWPVIDAGQGPSLRAPAPLPLASSSKNRPFETKFTEAKLAPGWQWPVQNRPAVQLGSAAGGELVLAPQAEHEAEPLGAVLARSATEGDYTATTSLEPSRLKAGVEAGLSLVGDPANAIGLSVTGKDAFIWQTQKGARQELGRVAIAPWPRVHLRLTVSGGYHVAYAVSPDGQTWTSFPTVGDGGFVPPWDRSVRVALTAGGAPGAEARFSFLRIEPK